ncbi:MAG TPA: AsmA-like C-terminal region-containing protein [Isosphaeraceae bacterium]|nr:AsmA-like C-terminal region-containing protein [Isosphaeraceae bacterium]
MAIRRWRWTVRLLVGLILIPVLLWLVVVVVAPTGWARRQVVAAMEARSGRRVGLERLSVCPLGGIHLINLEIGSPQGRSDPWLKAADLRLDLSLLQIFRGRLHPRRLEADGVQLRILRRSDGTVELADLIKPIQEPARGSTAVRVADRVAFSVRRGQVTVIDEPTETRLQLEEVEGEGSSEGPLTLVDHLRGTLNGGPFRLAAQLDRTDAAMSLEAQFRAEDVAVDPGMKVLRYVVPILAGAAANLNGRLHADLYLQGRGASWNDLCQALVGQGVIALKSIDLQGAPLVAELSKLVDLANPRRLASIQSDFLIKDRRVTTDHFTMNLLRLPITMSGWTDLDGRIDYEMKVEGLTGRLPERARRVLGELNLDVGSLTTLTLRGTLNQMAVQVNGVPIHGSMLQESGPRRDDRERLRLLGRQLRDRLLR